MQTIFAENVRQLEPSAAHALYLIDLNGMRQSHEIMAKECDEGKAGDILFLVL